MIEENKISLFLEKRYNKIISFFFKIAKETLQHRFSGLIGYLLRI